MCLFSKVITVTHGQLRMMHPNDPRVLFNLFFLAGFIIPSQKALKRNIARYFVILAC